MADVRTHVSAIVSAIASAKPPAVDHDAIGKNLGACPACGKPVRSRGRVYACDTGRACPFVVFQSMAKRKISAKMVRKLLTEGRSDLVKGFKSKKGKAFRAALIWDASKERVGFWFPPRVAVGDRCPECDSGRIIRGRSSLGCNRWREGCGFRSGS